MTVNRFFKNTVSGEILAYDALFLTELENANTIGLPLAAWQLTILSNTRSWEEIQPEAALNSVNPSKTVTEKLAEDILNTDYIREEYIANVEWRVARYDQQMKLGGGTTDDRDTYIAILVYIQALRDITNQSGYPAEVIWPVLA